MQQVPGTRSAFAERGVSGYYVDIDIDRTATARYGLNAGDVHDAIMATVGGLDAAQTVEGRERYAVNVRYPRELRDNVDTLITIPNQRHYRTARAAPDGYTLVVSGVASHVVVTALSKVPYDPIKDFRPIVLSARTPLSFVGANSLPAKSVSELVALAKAKPGALDFASTGVGSASHLAGELFNQRAGVDIVHIPYKGGGPAMTDLLGGRVSTYYSTHSTAGPHIETGKLRAIAVTGAKRSTFLPNVPTIAESGFPGFEASNWYAFVTSAKVPAPILERWNKELVKALSAPDVKEQLAKHFLEPSPGTREELAAYIKQEYDNWGRVVKKANIQAN